MAMKSVVGLVCVWLSLSAVAQAQDHCQFGSPNAAAHFEQRLKAAKSCAEAKKEYSDCRRGSSADNNFASIVIKRCEQDFLPSFSLRQKKRFSEEMHLCGYEYSRSEGTLAVSEAATCAVDVSARYAANPKLAGVPFPRASFDCAKAKTRLELAICSDDSVGRADVVLARVYAPTVKFLDEPDRSKLIASEREWLKALPERCELGSDGPFSVNSLACLRREIEIRFTIVNSCEDGENVIACLAPAWAQQLRDGAQGEQGRAAAAKTK